MMNAVKRGEADDNSRKQSALVQSSNLVLFKGAFDMRLNYSCRQINPISSAIPLQNRILHFILIRANADAADNARLPPLTRPPPCGAGADTLDYDRLSAALRVIIKSIQQSQG